MSYITVTRYKIKVINNGLLEDPTSWDEKIFNSYGYDTKEEAIKTIEEVFHDCYCEFVIIECITRK